MSLESRVESLESDGVRGGKPTGEAGWVYLHIHDHRSLTHLQPEPVHEIREAYRIPEGKVLRYMGDEIESEDVVAQVWFNGGQWTDSGSLSRHEVDAAPVVETLDLSAADAWRLRWIRWRAARDRALYNVMAEHFEDERFHEGLTRAAHYYEWAEPALFWFADTPHPDLETHDPEVTPEGIEPPPEVPEGFDTWEDTADALRQERSNLNPHAMEEHRVGTPEESDRIAVAEWLARLASVPEIYAAA